MKTNEEKERDQNRYNELKQLAEMAWVAILIAGYDSATKPSTFAEDAWAFAEFMLIESERRRPK